ncbi:hypothetical protein DI09_16p190 [Mitosporidium daphniae]|uniref:Uncharacterized protein n=1 Tax=Mitosporidium daphniae TaxID=1485682 RepID=A0A098VU48_9MICR|nr:uncharacterized protein DI09_16p190 [Mitosporidium daphniae]KGG52465.1 hypothetical protein DI09_16p190 [Mitosporidium daphniae]|eukprot:XP_013238892.1 uncharacterized protein DI09_16p190 [Mitosporidium daphniae]
MLEFSEQELHSTQYWCELEEKKKDSLVEKKLKCLFSVEPIAEYRQFSSNNQYGSCVLTSGIVPREVADQLPFLRSHDSMMFPPALVGIIILLTILATLLSC